MLGSSSSSLSLLSRDILDIYLHTYLQLVGGYVYSSCDDDHVTGMVPYVPLLKKVQEYVDYDHYEYPIEVDDACLLLMTLEEGTGYKVQAYKTVSATGTCLLSMNVTRHQGTQYLVHVRPCNLGM